MSTQSISTDQLAAHYEQMIAKFSRKIEAAVIAGNLDLATGLLSMRERVIASLASLQADVEFLALEIEVAEGEALAFDNFAYPKDAEPELVDISCTCGWGLRQLTEDEAWMFGDEHASQFVVTRHQLVVDNGTF